MPALDYVIHIPNGPQMSLLGESIIYLLAAVIAVPLSRRLGFGSVLGYLAAGIIIGPFGFAFSYSCSSSLVWSSSRPGSGFYGAWCLASAQHRFSRRRLLSLS